MHRFVGVLSRFSLNVLAALVGLMVPALPAKADPIGAEVGSLTLPFSGHISVAFGDFEPVFGRPIHKGDTLSGRISIAGPALRGDSEPDPSLGLYIFGSGRFEFDVPSGFSLVANPLQNDPLFGSVANNHSCDNTICDEFAISLNVGSISSAQVVWSDLTARAFNDDAFPTTPDILSRFGVVRFQLFDDSRLFLLRERQNLFAVLVVSLVGAGCNQPQAAARKDTLAKLKPGETTKLPNGLEVTRIDGTEEWRKPVSLEEQRICMKEGTRFFES
jgi:hypothetical protein